VPNDVLARAPVFLPWQNNFPVRRKIILSAVKKIRLLVIDLNQQARCHFAQL